MAPLKAGEAAAGDLWNRHAQGRGIGLGPALHAQTGQVAAKRGHSATVPGAGEEALVGRETASADHEGEDAARGASGDGAGIPNREPHQTGPAVGPGGRVVGVDQAGKGDAFRSRRIAVAWPVLAPGVAPAAGSRSG